MNDLKFACRQLLKNPGFTAVALLTLALGIGANTAVFSLMNSILFRTVSGVRNPDQLLAFDFKPGEKSNPLPVFSYPDFIEFRDGADVFADMAAYRREAVTIGALDRTEKTQALLVTPNWFQFLGVRMIVGRGFAFEEGGLAEAITVAVISESLWKRRFDADPGIVGRSIEINGTAFTVVGVAAPFRFSPAFNAEIWVPVAQHAPVQARSTEMPHGNLDPLRDRRRSWLRWMARLEAGVPIKTAQAAVAVRAQQLDDAYGPETVMGQFPLTVLPQSQYNRRDLERAAPVGIFLMAVALLVLLIACANLANLLLARATVRRRELAIRSALGATHRRILRQLLTEGMLLALMGGGAGLLLSGWTAGILNRFIGDVTAFAIQMDVRPEWNVFAYASGLSMVAGLVFSLAPARRAARPDLVQAMRNGAGETATGIRGLSFRNMLVVGQVAICFLLLVVAGLFARGLQEAHRVDPGFEPEGVLALPIELGPRQIPVSEGFALFEGIKERLSEIPGVAQVSFARFCQGDEHSILSFTCKTANNTETNYFAWGNQVGPDYFQTLETRIVRGRGFVRTDRSGPPVVIVNEWMADDLWPGQNPVGRAVQIAEHTAGGEGPVWAEVVGVAENGHYLSLFQHDRRRFLYQPVGEVSSGSMTVFIRVAGRQDAMLPVLRSTLRDFDDRLPTYRLVPLAEKIASWRLLPQLGAILVGAIGLIGLLLAAVGLYGLLAYLVNQRTQEFGVRMALGAQRHDVTRLVMRQGLSLVLFGSLIGLVAAFAGTRLIAHLLFGVNPLDVASFVGVSLLLTVVTLLACYLPARRAAKADPMEALRTE